MIRRRTGSGWLIIFICAVAGPWVTLCAGRAEIAGDRKDSRGAAIADAPRKRLREIGIVIGRMAPGPNNAITDVQGVRVGQVTLVRGEGKLVPGRGPVRTGVTAILPHGGDLWRDKVPAATWVLNGTGEMTGSIWIDTQGALEVPVLLTNTMNIGRVMDGVVAYMLRRYPEIGISDDVVAPTVAECDDSTLNDARGLHVSAEDTVRAIESAGPGPVAEGAVGAGTGMMSYQFKGGIGTASRVLPKEDGGFTVGVLVNANMGRRADLSVDGVPVGREIPERMPKESVDGSIIIVVATDAPLLPHQLKRIAKRAALGVGRMGGLAANSSGDIFIAFSTANPHASRDTGLAQVVMAPDGRITPLFEATVQATEEAIVNAMLAADTMTGADDLTVYALPHDRLREVLRKYNRLNP